MSPSNPADKIRTQVEALSSGDANTRRQAIRFLGQMGPEAETALPLLRSVLSDPDFVIRLEAAIAIGFIGTADETEYLLPLLDDDVEAVRFQTISALAFLKDSRTTPELLKRYENETVPVKDQILRALGHLGGQKAYKLLERELHANHPTIRTGAVVGFSLLGDSRVCQLLKEVIETDSDEIVVHEARIALLQIEDTSSQDTKKTK
jgi:HEAT repeat protein